MLNEKVEFRDISISNVREICRLEFAPGQLNFIIHNSISIAESQFIQGSKILSIYHDNIPIGFIMYVNADELKIKRFMIDAKYQGRGFGKIAS